MSDALAQARARHAASDVQGALDAYRVALSHSPEDVTALYEGAMVAMQLRQPGIALPWLRRAHTLAPTQVDVLLALAQVCRIAGLFDEAHAAARDAVRLAPGFAPAWMLCGSLEVAIGQVGAAEASLRRALALAPTLAEAWHFLGESLQAQRRWDEAIDAYREAMRAQPAEIFNIGLCAEQAGRWDEARAAYRRMAQLHPDRADCLARLAQVDALLCDFEAEAATVEALRARLASASPLRADDVPEPFILAWLPLPDTQRRDALMRYAAKIGGRARASAHGAAVTQWAQRQPRLRLGYIGPDFGQHAVGTLLRGLFAAHDRRRVEVFGYSLRRHEGALAAALQREFDVFRDVAGLASADIAATIRADGIDVLIDLGGFTQGARPEVLAARAAPVQWSWLGFVHAHEAPWLDALLLDDGVLPAQTVWPYTDRVLRLPGYLLPCGPLPQGRSDRGRFGLPEDVPLLASFNNSYKLDASLLDAWAEILRRAPEAHLAVYLPHAARPYLARQWQVREGDPARLHLLDRLPEAEQADRAASCDLFLDAFRYQAGATALACVAAGLPLLSRAGDSPLARLGASLNRFLGLDDLVCADAGDYVARAVALANDRAMREATRSRLREAAARCALFDPRRGAAAIETLLDAVMIPSSAD